MDYNIVNGGLILKTDGTLYYTDMEHYEGMYGLHKDGTRTKMTSSICWFMTSFGSNIFYSNEKDHHYLYQLDTQNGVEKLVLNRPCYGLIRYGEYLFFIDEADKSLYRMSADGSGMKKIVNQQLLSYFIDEHRIYYVTDDQIKVCSVDGGQSKTLLEESGVGLIKLGKALLYADRKKEYLLTQYDIPSGEIKVFEDIVTTSVNTDGKYVYCSNMKNEKSICRVSIDEGTSIRMSAEPSFGIHLIDDTIYFYNTGKKNRLYKMSISGGQAVEVMV